MTQVNRWQLPEGVAEILPADARRLEHLRREVLDLFHCWGYDQVIPPLLEYTESLLIGTANDLENLTLKVTDQMTGRTMGLRADITPQITRMDAHSWCQDGASRFSYVGTVVHSRPRSLLANRTPTQAGVELYGVQSLDGDAEVISLLLESLQHAGISEAHLNLGHVAIYRSLAQAAELSEEQELVFFDLLQRKAQAELDVWLEQNLVNNPAKPWFTALLSLAGGVEVLDKARQVLTGAPEAVVAALDELQQLATILSSRYPAANLYFDLSEIRGYHYHTGVMFAAFVPGYGEAVANGGRYDNVGEVFGRARPATGFSMDLVVIMNLALRQETSVAAILVADSNDALLWAEAQRLRQQGERIVFNLGDQAALRCDRQLLKTAQGFEIVDL